MKMKIRNKTAFTDEVTPLEKENAQVSYEAALEGIVLMENDGTLPLTTLFRSISTTLVQSRSLKGWRKQDLQ